MISPFLCSSKTISKPRISSFGRNDCGDDPVNVVNVSIALIDSEMRSPESQDWSHKLVLCHWSISTYRSFHGRPHVLNRVNVGGFWRGLEPVYVVGLNEFSSFLAAMLGIIVLPQPMGIWRRVEMADAWNQGSLTNLGCKIIRIHYPFEDFDMRTSCTRNPTHTWTFNGYLRRVMVGRSRLMIFPLSFRWTLPIITGRLNQT